MENLFHILEPLLIIFGVSSVVVTFFHFLKQPPIAGFILSGAIVGPFGLGWIGNLEQVNILAELGVILLLFSLGIEFSLQRLMQMGHAFLFLGGLQCLVTTFLVAALFTLLKYPWNTAFLYGSIVSLSSTAIVLKILQNHRETISPHGNLSIAVLLFQDIWVVPLLLLLPIISKTGTSLTSEPLWPLIISKGGQFIALLLLIYLGAKYIVPGILRAVAKTKIRELFIVTVAFLSLGMAWMTDQMGLSLAFGAFIAGMMISGSDYGHQAVSDMVPFRDPFIALFFVSVGMLLDVGFFKSHLFVIALLALSILVIKFGVTSTAASILGYDSRVCALTALFLAQIGEFSFLLARRGYDLGLMPHSDYQYFLSVTLVLLIFTPFLIGIAPKVAPTLGTFDIVSTHRKKTRRVVSVEGLGNHVDNHVVIVGFGFNGQKLAESLTPWEIPFHAIEINHDTVTHWKTKGIQISYGDAARPEILESVGIMKAKVAVVAINDRNWAPQVIRSIRSLRPEIHILVRTEYLKGVSDLEKAGASEIVVAEVETTLTLLNRTIKQYGLTQPSENHQIS